MGECTTYSNSGHYLNLNIAIFTSYESFIHIVIYSGECKLANLKMLEHVTFTFNPHIQNGKSHIFEQSSTFQIYWLAIVFACWCRALLAKLVIYQSGFIAEQWNYLAQGKLPENSSQKMYTQMFCSVEWACYNNSRNTTHRKGQ